MKTIIFIIDITVIILGILAIFCSITANNHYALVSWGAALGIYIKLILMDARDDKKGGGSIHPRASLNNNNN